MSPHEINSLPYPITLCRVHSCLFYIHLLNNEYTLIIFILRLRKTISLYRVLFPLIPGLHSRALVPHTRVAFFFPALPSSDEAHASFALLSFDQGLARSSSARPRAVHVLCKCRHVPTT